METTQWTTKPTWRSKKVYVRSEHYQAMKIEPIDVMDAWLTKEQMMGFLLGSVIKYIGRYNSEAEDKGGLRDLKKAHDYLKWAIASLPDESTDS